MASRKSVPHDGLSGPRRGLGPEQVTLSRQNAQSVQAVLAEVHELLQTYAPTWYSAELNDRLAMVLKRLEDEL